MSSQDYEGGVEAQRGFLFQTYGLLVYTLIRRLQFPDLEVVLESREDARFQYLVPERQSVSLITEYVQCKKRESSESPDLHAGIVAGDEWSEGKFHFADLKHWVAGAKDELSNDTSAYYTALVFGEIADAVQKFVPAKMPRLTYNPWRISVDFPVTYSHPENSSFKQNIGLEEGRLRVRVLPLGSPCEIEMVCRMLLERSYGVKEQNSLSVVRNLRVETENRATAKPEENRTLSRGDIESIIAAGRVGQGRWVPVAKFLERDINAEADVNKGESPRWIDFENSRYAHRDKFDEAWEALERDRFLVLSGPAGVGKTTFCRYLAFRFLKEHPTHRAYYLLAQPNKSLLDEVDFLRQEIESDTLFMIGFC